MKKYVPAPLHTEHVKLPGELNALIEEIAENVHETWAAARIAEGWTHGETRDEGLKQSPCLVPYADLPETEKAYDRMTAIATLKFVIARGYRIEKAGAQQADRHADD